MIIDTPTNLELATRLFTLKCPSRTCSRVAGLRVVERDGGLTLGVHCSSCGSYASVYVTDIEVTDAGLWMIIEAVAALARPGTTSPRTSA